MEKKRKNNLPPAVVADLYYHGLGIVRALGRRNIPVIGIDSDPNAVGLGSRYCTGLTCPPVEGQEEAHIDFMIGLSKKSAVKPVLFPASDEYVMAYAKHESVLKDYYRFTGPCRETIEKVVTKDAIFATAVDSGVAVPDTYIVSSPEDLVSVSSQIPYPCLVKPVASKSWRSKEMRKTLGGMKKVIVAKTPGELSDTYHKIRALSPHVIVSEVIPGCDSQLHYINYYVSGKGEILGMVMGKKFRTIPIHFGSASFVVTTFDRRLSEIAADFLRAIEYRGLGGMEFKQDERDGEYKLIEINARFGLWQYTGILCGVDFPYIAYRDVIGEDVEPVNGFKEGIKWVSVTRDLRAFLGYRREGSLNASEWLRSMQGEKMWAVYSPDDMRPFFASVKNDTLGLVRSILRKLNSQ